MKSDSKMIATQSAATEAASDLLQRLDVVALFGLQPVDKSDYREQTNDVVEPLTAFVKSLNKFAKSHDGFAELVSAFEELIDWERDLKTVIGSSHGATMAIEALIAHLHTKMTALLAPTTRDGTFFLARAIFHATDFITDEFHETCVVYRFTRVIRADTKKNGVRVMVTGCGTGDTDYFPPDACDYPQIRRKCSLNVFCSDTSILLDNDILWGLVMGCDQNCAFQETKFLYECVLPTIGTFVDDEKDDVLSEKISSQDTNFHPVYFLWRQCVKDQGRDVELTTEKLRNMYRRTVLHNLVLDKASEHRFAQCKSSKKTIQRSHTENFFATHATPPNTAPSYATVGITAFGPSSLLHQVTQSMDRFGGARIQGNGNFATVDFRISELQHDSHPLRAFELLSKLWLVVCRLMDKSSVSPWPVVAMQVMALIETHIFTLPLDPSLYGSFSRPHERTSALTLLRDITLTYCRCSFSINVSHEELYASRVLCTNSLLALVDIMMRCKVSRGEAMGGWKFMNALRRITVGFVSWNGIETATILQRHVLVCSPRVAKQRKKLLLFCERNARKHGTPLLDWKLQQRFGDVKFQVLTSDETFAWLLRLREQYDLLKDRAPPPAWRLHMRSNQKKKTAEEAQAEWLASDWVQEKAIRALLDVQICAKFGLEARTPSVTFADPCFPRIMVNDIDRKRRVIISINFSGDEEQEVESSKPYYDMNTVISRFLDEANGRTASGESSDEENFEVAEPITEDSILLSESVPTFGGALSPEDAEYMLSFLSTPQLSIPAILEWLASRSGLLLNDVIANLVLHALFDPGPFSEVLKAPQRVPAASASLATPLGRLEFEARSFPETILCPLFNVVTEVSRLALHAGNPVETPFAPLFLNLCRYVVYIVRFTSLNSIHPAELEAMSAIRQWITDEAIPLLIDWIHTADEQQGHAADNHDGFVVSLHAHLGLLGASIFDDDDDNDRSDELPFGMRILALGVVKMWGGLSTLDTESSEYLMALLAAKELACELEEQRERILRFSVKAWDRGGLLKADLCRLFDQCSALQNRGYTVLDVRNPQMRISVRDWRIADSQVLSASLEYRTPNPLEPYWEVEKKIEFPGAQMLEVTFCPGTFLGRGGSVTLYKDSSRTEFWGEKDMSGYWWPGLSGRPLLVVPRDKFYLVIRTGPNPEEDETVLLKVSAPVSAEAAEKLREDCNRMVSRSACELALKDAKHCVREAHDLLMTHMQGYMDRAEQLEKDAEVAENGFFGTDPNVGSVTIFNMQSFEMTQSSRREVPCPGWFTESLRKDVAKLHESKWYLLKDAEYVDVWETTHANLRYHVRLWKPMYRCPRQLTVHHRDLGSGDTTASIAGFDTYGFHNYPRSTPGGGVDFDGGSYHPLQSLADSRLDWARSLAHPHLESMRELLDFNDVSIWERAEDDSVPPILIWVRAQVDVLSSYPDHPGGLFEYRLNAAGVIEMWRLDDFGRRLARTLLHAMDYRKQFGPVKFSSGGRKKWWPLEWTRYATSFEDAPWLTPEAGDSKMLFVRTRCVREVQMEKVLRVIFPSWHLPDAQNFSESTMDGSQFEPGTCEQYANDMLVGILPDCILKRYQIWWVSERYLRGYALNEDDAETKNAYVKQDASFVTFVKDRMLIIERDSARGGLIVRQFGVPTDSAVQAEGLRLWEDEKRLPPCWDSMCAANPPLTLLDPTTFTGFAAEVATQISLLDTFAYASFWTDALPTTSSDAKPEARCTIHSIDVPRLGLSFRRSARGLELTAYPGTYLVMDQDIRFQLCGQLPHGCVLEKRPHEPRTRFMLLPNMKLARVEISEAPDIVELRPEADQVWANIGSTRAYLYPLHISALYFIPPTLASTLYLVYAYMQVEEWELAHRYLSACSSDMPLDEEERTISEYISGDETVPDLCPERSTLRLRLRLFEADCGEAIQLSRYAPLYTHYLNSRSALSLGTRLSIEEERTLLRSINLPDHSAYVDAACRRDAKWELPNSLAPYIHPCDTWASFVAAAPQEIQSAVAKLDRDEVRQVPTVTCEWTHQSSSAVKITWAVQDSSEELAPVIGFAVYFRYAIDSRGEWNLWNGSHQTDESATDCVVGALPPDTHVDICVRAITPMKRLPLDVSIRCKTAREPSAPEPHSPRILRIKKAQISPTAELFEESPGDTTGHEVESLPDDEDIKVRSTEIDAPTVCSLDGPLVPGLGHIKSKLPLCERMTYDNFPSANEMRQMGFVALYALMTNSEVLCGGRQASGTFAMESAMGSLPNHVSYAENEKQTNKTDKNTWKCDSCNAPQESTTLYCSNCGQMNVDALPYDEASEKLPPAAVSVHRPPFARMFLKMLFFRCRCSNRFSDNTLALPSSDDFRGLSDPLLFAIMAILLESTDPLKIPRLPEFPSNSEQKGSLLLSLTGGPARPWFRRLMNQVNRIVDELALPEFEPAKRRRAPLLNLSDNYALFRATSINTALSSFTIDPSVIDMRAAGIAPSRGGDHFFLTGVTLPTCVRDAEKHIGRRITEALKTSKDPLRARLVKDLQDRVAPAKMPHLPHISPRDLAQLHTWTNDEFPRPSHTYLLAAWSEVESLRLDCQEAAAALHTRLCNTWERLARNPAVSVTSPCATVSLSNLIARTMSISSPDVKKKGSSATPDAALLSDAIEQMCVATRIGHLVRCQESLFGVGQLLKELLKHAAYKLESNRDAAYEPLVAMMVDASCEAAANNATALAALSASESEGTKRGSVTHLSLLERQCRALTIAFRKGNGDALRGAVFAQAQRDGHGDLTDAQVDAVVRVARDRMVVDAAVKLPDVEKWQPNSDPPLGPAEGVMVELVEACARCVSILGAERTYGQTLDPRFLYCEFTLNIILRRNQVDVILQLYKKAHNDGSAVKQLLMGQGKSAVIAPLLGLLLADGRDRGVVHVVPDVLLLSARNCVSALYGFPLQARIATIRFERGITTYDAAHKVRTKIECAFREMGCVITTASAVKGILLQYLDLQKEVKNCPAILRVPSKVLASEYADKWDKVTKLAYDIRQKDLAAEELGDLLRLWRDKCVAVIDEVDLVLHPLKSELNFPIGIKIQPEPGELRWLLPEFLLDCVLGSVPRMFCLLSYLPGEMVVQREITSEFHLIAMNAITSLRASLELGKQKVFVQTAPHLVLLSTEWYHNTLKAPLARLCAAWICVNSGAKELSTLSMYPPVHSFITHASDDMPVDIQVQPGDDVPDTELVDRSPDATPSPLRLRQFIGTKKQKETDGGMRKKARQVLNVARCWLDCMLPHCLAKRDRIDYGLIRQTDLDAWAKNEFMMASTERKDAIRKEVRPVCKDPIAVSAILNRHFPTSNSRLLLAVPFTGLDMPSKAAEFASTDVAIGLTFLSLRHSGMRRNDIRTLILDLRKQLSREPGPYERRPTRQTFDQWVGKKIHIPLELIEPNNRQCIDCIVPLLKHNSDAIQYYVNHLVFATSISQQTQRISASGVDVAAEKQIFRVRLGFTGTPNDLFPPDIDQDPDPSWKYQPGDDAQILRTLSNPAVMSIELLPRKWSPESILRKVATSKCNALIDVGALITGRGGKDTVCEVLREGCEGCVVGQYLDADNRKMAIFRDGREAALEEVGAPFEQRFTYYDHAHTTGIDIKQAPVCMAAITLGKDVSLRDFAQGAWRMRGLGNGQNLRVLIPPEMWKQIDLRSWDAGDTTWGTVNVEEALVSVLRWLIDNQLNSERCQAATLARQVLANKWRAQVFARLFEITCPPIGHVRVLDNEESCESVADVDEEQPLLEHRFGWAETAVDEEALEKVESLEVDMPTEADVIALKRKRVQSMTMAWHHIRETTLEMHAEGTLQLKPYCSTLHDFLNELCFMCQYKKIDELVEFDSHGRDEMEVSNNTFFSKVPPRPVRISVERGSWVPPDTSTLRVAGTCIEVVLEHMHIHTADSACAESTLPSRLENAKRGDLPWAAALWPEYYVREPTLADQLAADLGLPDLFSMASLNPLMDNLDVVQEQEQEQEVKKEVAQNAKVPPAAPFPNAVAWNIACLRAPQREKTHFHKINELNIATTPLDMPDELSRLFYSRNFASMDKPVMRLRNLHTFARLHNGAVVLTLQEAQTVRFIQQANAYAVRVDEDKGDAGHKTVTDENNVPLVTQDGKPLTRGCADHKVTLCEVFARWFDVDTTLDVTKLATEGKSYGREMLRLLHVNTPEVRRTYFQHVLDLRPRRDRDTALRAMNDSLELINLEGIERFHDNIAKLRTTLEQRNMDPRQQFKEIVSDREDGVMNEDMLKTFCAKWCQSILANDLPAMFKGIDRNGDGMLTMSEFLRAIKAFEPDTDAPRLKRKSKKEQTKEQHQLEQDEDFEAVATLTDIPLVPSDPVPPTRVRRAEELGAISVLAGDEVCVRDFLTVNSDSSCAFTLRGARPNQTCAYEIELVDMSTMGYVRAGWATVAGIEKLALGAAEVDGASWMWDLTTQATLTLEKDGGSFKAFKDGRVLENGTAAIKGTEPGVPCMPLIYLYFGAIVRLNLGRVPLRVSNAPSLHTWVARVQRDLFGNQYPRTLQGRITETPNPSDGSVVIDRDPWSTSDKHPIVVCGPLATEGTVEFTVTAVESWGTFCVMWCDMAYCSKPREDYLGCYGVRRTYDEVETLYESDKLRTESTRSIRAVANLEAGEVSIFDADGKQIGKPQQTGQLTPSLVPVVEIRYGKIVVDMNVSPTRPTTSSSGREEITKQWVYPGRGARVQACGADSWVITGLASQCTVKLSDVALHARKWLYLARVTNGVVTVGWADNRSCGALGADEFSAGWKVKGGSGRTVSAGEEGAERIHVVGVRDIWALLDAQNGESQFALVSDNDSLVDEPETAGTKIRVIEGYTLALTLSKGAEVTVELNPVIPPCLAAACVSYTPCTRAGKQTGTGYSSARVISETANEREVIFKISGKARQPLSEGGPPPTIRQLCVNRAKQETVIKDIAVDALEDKDLHDVATLLGAPVCNALEACRLQEVNLDVCPSLIVDESTNRCRFNCLSTLKLERVGLTGDTPWLSLLPALKELDLSNNALGDSGVQQVVCGETFRYDASRTGLCVLVMRQCELTPSGIVTLMNALRSDLRELDVSYNNIGLQGSLAIGRMTQLRGASLGVLNVSHAQPPLFADAIVPLIAYLNAPRLRTLILSGNRIGVGGMEAVGRLLDGSTSMINHLDVSECGVGKELHIISNACGAGALRHLYIARNFLGGCHAELSVLLKARLVTLNIEGARLNEKDVERLCQLFKEEGPQKLALKRFRADDESAPLHLRLDLLMSGLAKCARLYSVHFGTLLTHDSTNMFFRFPLTDAISTGHIELARLLIQDVLAARETNKYVDQGDANQALEAVILADDSAKVKQLLTEMLGKDCRSGLSINPIQSRLQKGRAQMFDGREEIVHEVRYDKVTDEWSTKRLSGRTRMTPLVMACASGQYKIAAFLCQRNECVLSTNYDPKEGRIAMLFPAEKKHRKDCVFDATPDLIGVNETYREPNAKADAYSFSIQRHSVRCGWWELVDALCVARCAEGLSGAAGASSPSASRQDPQRDLACDSHRRTLLHDVCRGGVYLKDDPRQVAFAERFLQSSEAHRELIEAQDERKRLPAHYAAACGRADVLRALGVRNKEKQSAAEDDAGWTPLALACYHNHIDCVEALLEFGAPPLEVRSTFSVFNLFSCLHSATINSVPSYYEVTLVVLGAFQDKDSDHALIPVCSAVLGLLKNDRSDVRAYRERMMWRIAIAGMAEYIVFLTLLVVTAFHWIHRDPLLTEFALTEKESLAVDGDKDGEFGAIDSRKAAAEFITDALWPHLQDLGERVTLAAPVVLTTAGHDIVRVADVALTAPPPAWLAQVQSLASLETTVQYTLLNPDISGYLQVDLGFEFRKSRKADLSSSFVAFSPVDSFAWNWYTVCEVLLLVLLVRYIITEILEMRGKKEKVLSGVKQWAADWWNWADMIVYTLVIVAFSIHAVILSKQSTVRDGVYTDASVVPEIASLADVQVQILAVTTTIAALKALKHLRMAPKIGPHVQALCGCVVDSQVLYFFLFFLIIAMCFAIGIVVGFGSLLEGFRTIGVGFNTMLRAMIEGGFSDDNDLESVHATMGTVFNLLLILVISQVVSGTLFSILVKAYEDQQENLESTYDEYVDTCLAKDAFLYHKRMKNTSWNGVWCFCRRVPRVCCIWGGAEEDQEDSDSRHHRGASFDTAGVGRHDHTPGDTHHAMRRITQPKNQEDNPRDTTRNDQKPTDKLHTMLRAEAEVDARDNEYFTWHPMDPPDDPVHQEAAISALEAHRIRTSCTEDTQQVMSSIDDLKTLLAKQLE
eukprot:GEMP01000006.1.p1 GENE.GEMP01000006.1~~GEMP01000006.1.p1  ORF type:complete len:6297 (+),score=1454.64 GEMP01000006.1:279-19169(+)